MAACICGCTVQQGFVQTSQGTIYRDASGQVLKGMQTINKNKYLFDEKGYMMTGFQEYENQFYYFDENGKMSTGMKTILSDTYLFDENGVRLSGIQTYEGNTYCFNEEGKLIKNQNVSVDGHKIVNVDGNGMITQMIPDVMYLQEGVQSIASAYGGNVSVYFKDLASNESFYMNPQVFYPCCMIKVPALATIMEQIAQGKFTYEEYSRYINPMIIVSDNTSFNRMMKKIGDGDGVAGVNLVNDFCSRMGLNQTAVRHGLRPGEDYFTMGYGGNESSAQDLGLLFEKIYRRELTGSDLMIDLLLQCDDDDELMSGLPAGTSFANKTGCAYALYHDGGIVFGPNRDYVLVVFQDGVVHHQDMMGAISSFIYEYEQGM